MTAEKNDATAIEKSGTKFSSSYIIRQSVCWKPL